MAGNPLEHLKIDLLVIGRGVRLAGISCLRLDIPTATTFLGKDIVCNSIGCIGIKGNKKANEALFKAKVVLIIGASLPIAQMGYDYKKFNKRKLIIVNVEKPNCLVKPYKFIKQDAKKFILKYL